MVYIAVRQTEDGSWEIVKVLTGIYNQRSPITDITVGDISRLDAAGRLMHGFFIQPDVYVGTGEFCEFDSKVVTFDDVEGYVINTYNYKLMDLDYIRSEMKNRVREYRKLLMSDIFTKNDVVYDVSNTGMIGIQGLVIESLINESLVNVSIRLPNDTDLILTVAELKQLFIDISTFRKDLFDKESQILLAIDSAANYDEIRNVSVWDDVIL